MRYVRAGGLDVWSFERYEDAFPQPLKSLPEGCPYFKSIYLVGDRSALDAPLIAVVGSRSASPEALERAGELGRLVAGCGHLVTGLAPGVDTSAALGALRAGGRVVGVRPWLVPPDCEIFSEVVSKGCILSHNLRKLLDEQKWVNSQFFLRNMLVALLSRVVVVVEARPGGGTMHMLEVASKRWRPVYVLEPPASEGEAWEAFDEFVGAGAIPVNSPEALVRALNAGEL